MEKRVVEVKAARPRLFHEYGDGYVLSVTIQDTDPEQRAELTAALRGMQAGYVKVTVKRLGA